MRLLSCSKWQFHSLMKSKRIASNFYYITQPAITFSKLIIKTLEERVNFEDILTPSSSVSIINFEQVNVDWESTTGSIGVARTPANI